MGIQGLLPLLKEVQQPRHISDFRGKTLAVDAYVWLHKGAFGCAEDLVKGRKTTKFVDYAMFRVRMLQHHNIRPFVVFDGGPLPAKRGTEDSRAKSRADHLARARSYEAQGRAKDARDAYTKCVDITPEMAYQLIKALRAEGIDYVVAPYEADAQLYYLEREGVVDGIITEDSDLLVFGCKTVIFKLEKDGSCVSIESRRFGEVRELDLTNWTNLQFRRMAMLSGCDYLPSIPGIGVKKAHRLLRRCKTVDKVLKSLRLEGAHLIPPTYAKDFERAEKAFLYQRVFCPHERKLVLLNEPHEELSEDDQQWVGLDVEIEIARGMATGDLHPETRTPIDDLWPHFQPTPRKGKGLVAGSGGTLDAFIKRIPRTKSTPALRPSHPRIGGLANGPTRMSDLPSLTPKPLRKYNSEPAPIPPPQASAGTKSKFFARKVQPVVEEPAEVIDLLYEDSTQVASPPRLEREATPEDIPSPIQRHRSLSHISTIYNSPAAERLDLQEDADDDDVPFTSPVSVHSGFDTIPGSTPRKSKDFVDEAEPPRPEPSSPTPTQRSRLSQWLVPPTLPVSQAAATIASSQRSDWSEEEYGPEDYVVCAPLRPVTSVLVPPSSPWPRSVQPARAIQSHLSSESAPDDEIVTPSPLNGSKRRRPVEDLDPAEQAREARAKTVAAGWREKYALKATSFTPPARRTGGRPSVPGFPVTAMSNALSPLSINIPREYETPKAAAPAPFPAKLRHVEARRQPVPAAKPSPQPFGVSGSTLERFRYKRQ
ncbi:hypothetical protein CC85DRAFT_282659 [Cutaneotrichosporon oleaginosum]|uniref:Uncharacterized protein n=1 Tax=Cutaneotrichosporon oleaginosum TaxID=879819 RepID=A0A0J0XVR2_9TREE|nr:uncharacterized protein CC85DRAFT_282659 [Cutaneotrichosporon oleaginosum]KLT45167.1 hypothetical protein CC85DRAFT_282659 [Cutaneotrichosporon oleaginosum]TXT14996.1 hypothetical protein COLE_01189 [Cutaneotrichosporon oleaginosum]